MLHSIATGNMLPSWVKIVCVDINPAVATKVSDRGTGQAVGVVADVGLFLDLLARRLDHGARHEASLYRRTRRGRRRRRAARNRNLAQPVSRITRSRSSCRSSPRCAPRPDCRISASSTLRYVPDKQCLELKSFKMYLLAYRNLGIFQENVVNRFLRDVVRPPNPCAPRSSANSRRAAA